MSLFRSRQPVADVDPVELVVPRATIDGWTLDGTPLARKVDRAQQRELSTLLHGVAVKVDTSWTYARAAELLEGCGEPAQAYAACEAWLRHPAAQQGDNAQSTRHVTRTRDRLRSRLAAVS